MEARGEFAVVFNFSTALPLRFLPFGTLISDYLDPKPIIKREIKMYVLILDMDKRQGAVYYSDEIADAFKAVKGCTELIKNIEDEIDFKAKK